MTLPQKLKLLTEGRNRAQLSREAGFYPNALSDCINKGWRPGLDRAIAIAKLLQVSLDWLVDDTQGWPPRRRKRSVDLSLATDQQLADEIRRRRQLKRK